MHCARNPTRQLEAVLVFIWSRPKAKEKLHYIDALFQQFLVPFSHHTVCSGANQLTNWWNEPKKVKAKRTFITHRPDVLLSVFPRLLFDWSGGTCATISKKQREVNSLQTTRPFCETLWTAQPTAVAGLVQKWLVVPAVGSDWAKDHVLTTNETAAELQTSWRKSRYACFICFRCTNEAGVKAP